MDGHICRIEMKKRISEHKQTEIIQYGKKREIRLKNLNKLLRMYERLSEKEGHTLKGEKKYL